MNRLGSLLLAVVCCASGTQASADVTVPNVLEAINGSGSYDRPFLGLGGERYQQVYASSQFAALEPGGELITGMAFRVDNLLGDPFDTIVVDPVTINLSTTSAGPDSLSLTFADNLGADNQIVLDGSVTLTGAAAPGPGSTRAFEMVIEFTNPFFYDPAGGNLLMDILNADTADNASSWWDGDGPNSDAVGRVINTSDPFTQVGDSTDRTGVVTRFVTVPEPSASASAMALVLGLGSLCRRRRRRGQA